MKSYSVLLHRGRNWIPEGCHLLWVTSHQQNMIKRAQVFSVHFLTGKNVLSWGFAEWTLYRSTVGVCTTATCLRAQRLVNTKWSCFIHQMFIVHLTIAKHGFKSCGRRSEQNPGRLCVTFPWLIFHCFGKEFKK